MPNLHLMRSSRSGGLPKLVSCLFFQFLLGGHLTTPILNWEQRPCN